MKLGIANPVAWAKSIDDDLLDWWLAYYYLEPWSDSPALTAPKGKKAKPWQTVDEAFENLEKRGIMRK